MERWEMILRLIPSRLNVATRKAAYPRYVPLCKLPPFATTSTTPRAPTVHLSDLTTWSFTMAGDQAAASGVAAAGETKALPPLTDHEFKIYNRMADRMEQFHNYFRQTWTLLWTAATTSRRPQNLTVKQFLSEAISFASHLSTHHGIEEAHVFPHLAARMPEFDAKRGSLVRQHEQIHKGLEEFETYVKACHAGREDFEMGVLKSKMEGWGGVLWAHLDEEVEMLGAERMRAVWSKEEMVRMPM